MIADQKQLWLTDHIWPEIHAMMHNDAYFRLWLKAQELAGRPYGPIAQTMINGYATYQWQLSAECATEGQTAFHCRSF